MQDNHKTYVFALWPQHPDDILFVDCIFSSCCSIQGYICFQIHVLKQSKIFITKNLKKDTHASDAYLDVIIKYGAPNKITSNNVHIYLDSKWTSINCKYYIGQGRTVPYHQSSNYT